MVKAFSQLEKEIGQFAYNPSKWPQSLTKEDFLKLLHDNMTEFHGVDYEKRVEFLKANGYEVNRENLINGHLSARV